MKLIFDVKNENMSKAITTVNKHKVGMTNLKAGKSIKEGGLVIRKNKSSISVKEDTS